MRISIFPKFEEKSTVLTWMNRQEGFMATDTAAKLPGVCGLREIPAKDKYSSPTLEVLTKELATASEIVRILSAVQIEKEYTNCTELKVSGNIRIVVVAKAHDFWKVCRALKTISFVNTEKEMVKGDFEGELIAGEVYLQTGEVTFSSRIKSCTFKVWNSEYPNHKEVAQWILVNPFFELSAITPEVSNDGMPQSAVRPNPEPPRPSLSNLAFYKEVKYDYNSNWQAFLDWAAGNEVSIVLNKNTYTVQFDGGNDQVDLPKTYYHDYPEKVNFRFASVPQRELLEKVRALLGLSDLDLVSKVVNLDLPIETVYALGFIKKEAEGFFEFVRRGGFVARYDISKKEMVTSQTFSLAEVTPEQLAAAKKKLEAFIAKVISAAENH